MTGLVGDGSSSHLDVFVVLAEILPESGACGEGLWVV